MGSRRKQQNTAEKEVANPAPKRAGKSAGGKPKAIESAAKSEVGSTPSIAGLFAVCDIY